MIPYPRGILQDNTHNYGIMKTEAVFGFGNPQQNFVNDSFNTADPLQWIITDGSFQSRTLQENQIPKPMPSITTNTRKYNVSKSMKTSKSKKLIQQKSNTNRKKKRKSKKVNKCIIKLKDGDGDDETIQERKKRKRKSGKMQSMQKKYMIPLLLGLLAAKSLLIPVALKALAFMSAKGFMMGFFSTVLASLISIKGMFSQPQYSVRKDDDTKTQVEIIHVPTKTEDHTYYDEPYKRGDYIQPYPLAMPDIQRLESNMLKKRTTKLLPMPSSMEIYEKNLLANKHLKYLKQ